MGIVASLSPAITSFACVCVCVCGDRRQFTIAYGVCYKGFFSAKLI